jgi:hypothetical protein
MTTAGGTSREVAPGFEGAGPLFLSYRPNVFPVKLKLLPAPVSELELCTLLLTSQAIFNTIARNSWPKFTGATAGEFRATNFLYLAGCPVRLGQ